MWQGHLSCNSSWGSLRVRAIHSDAPPGDLGQSGSCGLVRRHGSCISGAQSLCHPSVNFCMVLEEGARRHPPFCGRVGVQVSMEKTCVFRHQALCAGALRHGNTRKEFQRHTQNPESTSSLVHWNTSTQTHTSPPTRLHTQSDIHSHVNLSALMPTHRYPVIQKDLGSRKGLRSGNQGHRYCLARSLVHI